MTANGRADHVPVHHQANLLRSEAAGRSASPPGLRDLPCHRLGTNSSGLCSKQTASRPRERRQALALRGDRNPDVDQGRWGVMGIAIRSSVAVLPSTVSLVEKPLIVALQFVVEDDAANATTLFAQARW